MTNALSPEEIKLVRDGQKIKAIQSHRRRTGTDLRTSKAMVDALATYYATDPPPRPPGPHLKTVAAVMPPEAVMMALANYRARPAPSRAHLDAAVDLAAAVTAWLP